MLIIKFFLSLAVLFLSRNSLCLAQGTFGVTPAVVELSLGRGGTKIFSFELSNNSKESPAEFKVYAMDFEVDREGNPDFLEIGKSKYSCSRWIKVEPDKIAIGPGQSKNIIGKLIVPASASSGGYYSAVICELIAEKPKVNKGTLVTWRIAVLVRVSVLGGKIEKEAEAEDFYLRTLFEKEEDKKQGLTFFASLRNQGNIHIKAEGKLIVLTRDRKRKGEVDFKAGTGVILPDHLRDFTAIYDKFLPEGEYIARAVFRYGGMNSIEKEIPFSVTAGKQNSDKAGEGNAVAVSSLKLIPEKIVFKIPAGGFRTAGFTIQNQRIHSVRVQVSLGKEGGIENWFKIEPLEVTVDGGREAKFLLQVNIPQGAKEGRYAAKINIIPHLISGPGQEEELEPQSIEVSLEIPNF